MTQTEEEHEENTAGQKNKNVMKLLERNVQKLLPRRIEFVLAKTNVGAHPKTVGKAFYTRPGEKKDDTKERDVISKEKKRDKEEETKVNDDDEENGGFSLFKKPKTKRLFGSSVDKEKGGGLESSDQKGKKQFVLPTASRETQLISKTARSWLNMPSRRFANEDESFLPSVPTRVSKSLPSQEDEEERKEREREKKAQEKKEKEKSSGKDSSAISSVFKDIVSHAKAREEGTETPVASEAVFDWSEDKQGFEEKIASNRKSVLEEWVEMRKPDEWDMALDKGKTKKVRKNKLANKRPRHGKVNPFQQMAEKRQKK